MRIVIDARMFETGIGTYLRNLLAELEKLDRTNEYLVLMPKRLWKNYEPKAKNFRKVECNIEPYSAANQTQLPKFIKRLEPDLVHFAHFTVPLGFRLPFVVTIHDLTLLDFNTARGGMLRRLGYAGKQLVTRRVVKHAVQDARAIITPTQFVADDLARRFRFDQSKIVVTHEATEKIARKPTAPKIANPFILYAGNFYPHKNIAALVEAMPEVIKNHEDLQLVLVGPADYFQSKLKTQAKKLGIEKSVIFPGFVKYEELLGLYKATDLFVFPSLSEGFGLPPLEAMAQGTPVLSSEASCMPEVLGEAAIYFDPTDPENLADEIDAALNTPEELSRLKELGPKQAAKYSWGKLAKQTLEIYKQAGIR